MVGRVAWCESEVGSGRVESYFFSVCTTGADTVIDVRSQSSLTLINIRIIGGMHSGAFGGGAIISASTATVTQALAHAPSHSFFSLFLSFFAIFPPRIPVPLFDAFSSSPTHFLPCFSLSPQLTINSCLFENNVADEGGAIYVQGVATISNTDFQFNEGDWQGGAVVAASGSQLTMTNCNFRNNIVDNFGGALSVRTNAQVRRRRRRRRRR